jgi:D-arabinose 1-dehydrogenase-like Zn-dependent alcohol dehydrogenase
VRKHHHVSPLPHWKVGPGQKVGIVGLARDIGMIRMDEINTAYERMLKSDVKHRFVIDTASLESE